LHDVTEQAMRELVRLEVNVFQRGEKLVRPVRAAGADSRGNRVETAELRECDKVYMRKLLCQHIDWYKWDERVKADANGEHWRQVDAPDDVAKMVIASAGHWPFRIIAGVRSTPTMRHDGSIIEKPGYDQRTALFLDTKVKLPAIPDKPTKGNAEAALKLLTSLLQEFPFVNEPSRSVALSAILSAIARTMFDVVPAHGARAPTPGTGKSYLFDLVSAVLLGERCPVISVSSDSEGETEKRIIALALSGQQIINIDNVNGTLGGDALCQLIERPVCYFRPLGQSAQVRIDNRAIVFFNGNNCHVRGDMTRRVLLADLDARIEKPAEREFADDPVAKVLANRRQYIAACMVILRAYQEAGSPKVVKFPMNSFGEWSATVRSALVWLGEADPCLTIQKARDEDPELQRLAAFVSAASEHISGKQKALCVREIVDLGMRLKSDFGGGDYQPANADLNAVIMEFADRGIQVNNRSFGRWLNKFKGRVVDGFRINSLTDNHKKVERWFIEDMTAADANGAFSAGSTSDLRGLRGLRVSDSLTYEKLQDNGTFYRGTLETNPASPANPAMRSASEANSGNVFNGNSAEAFEVEL
jgi:putative DNA primase/helicase